MKYHDVRMCVRFLASPITVELERLAFGIT